jgi:hypothetical protein
MHSRLLAFDRHTQAASISRQYYGNGFSSAARSPGYGVFILVPAFIASSPITTVVNVGLDLNFFCGVTPGGLGDPTLSRLA